MKAGRNLRAELARRGVTQALLAERMGLYESTLVNIVNDAVGIDKQTFAAMMIRIREIESEAGNQVTQ